MSQWCPHDPLLYDPLLCISNCYDVCVFLAKCLFIYAQQLIDTVMVLWLCKCEMLILFICITHCLCIYFKMKNYWLYHTQQFNHFYYLIFVPNCISSICCDSKEGEREGERGEERGGFYDSFFVVVTLFFLSFH